MELQASLIVLHKSIFYRAKRAGQRLERLRSTASGDGGGKGVASFESVAALERDHHMRLWTPRECPTVHLRKGDRKPTYKNNPR